MTLKGIAVLIITLVLAIWLAGVVHPVTITTPTCGNAIMERGDTCKHTSATGSYDSTYEEEARGNVYDKNWPLQIVIWGVLLGGWYGGRRLYRTRYHAKNHSHPQMDEKENR